MRRRSGHSLYIRHGRGEELRDDSAGMRGRGDRTGLSSAGDGVGGGSAGKGFDLADCAHGKRRVKVLRCRGNSTNAPGTKRVICGGAALLRGGGGSEVGFYHLPG